MEQNYDTYSILFRINYKAKDNEAVYILGELKELGEWTQPLFRLSNKDSGDNWSSQLTLHNISSFQYKFVCVDEKSGKMRWEDGDNRSFFRLSEESSFNIDCIWNHFKVIFILSVNLNENENLLIVGNNEYLGKWHNPIEMKKIGETINYSQYSVQLNFNVMNPDSYEFEYRYIIYNALNGKFFLTRFDILGKRTK